MAEGGCARHTRNMRHRFEDIVLPHLNAAHRLARALLRNQQDAEDAVQESALRAVRYLDTFVGGNARAWFLRIVRNVCCQWHSRGVVYRHTDLFDETQHSVTDQAFDPEAQLMHLDDVTLIQRAMRNLPSRARALLQLREMQGLSYRELAEATGTPLGTVMSGLSRARHAFRHALEHELNRASRT